MKIKEYRKLTDEKLIKKIEETLFIISTTYGKIDTKKGRKPENRSRLRKEIAKMKTILRERQTI